jgi:Platelet-activating factor acetylhydrolase, isoform II
MRRVLIGLAVVVLLIAAQVIYNATMSPQVQAAPAEQIADLGQMGPYAIGHTNLMLYDPSRPGGRPGEAAYNGTSRPIPVSVWYPVDRATVAGMPSDALYPLDPLYGKAPDTHSSDWEPYGIDPAFEGPVPSQEKPFPLVVFSPGWGAPTWAHTSLGTRLASHGFVVAVMYHFGDQWWPWEPPYDPLGVASYNRPRDVSFVLSDLLQRNGTSGDLLYGLIKPERVAAGGWSLGGYAAMTLAGGDDSVCDTLYGQEGLEDPPAWTCVPSFPDPRIKVITPLDGSNQVLHFYELARITLPAMGIGEEWNMLALDPAFTTWQARQHAAFSGHPAYRVDLYNSIHQSFSDICEVAQVFIDTGVDPATGEWILDNFCTADIISSALAHQLRSKYMIAFLKTHLTGEPGYQNMLTPGWALTRESSIEFFATEKRNPNSIDEDWPDLFVYFPHQPGGAQARGPKDSAKTLPVARVGVLR